MMKQAACGLDCNACDLYKAKTDRRAAENLVPWFRQRGWISADEGAEAVMARVPFCEGCWETGVNWCGNCHMRTCCQQKDLADCGKCDSFPCKAYVEWTVDTPHHIEAMNKLFAQRNQKK
ncbi:MAG: DUF3795 domain-containing protein [Clostridia bacterium]|nr:DUF3795 domain-containing protein [Clostridia bacterium]